MENREFHPGIPPNDPEEQMAGLESAIDATRKRIAEYKAAGADVSELETHLQSLEQRWQSADRRSQKAA